MLLIAQQYTRVYGESIIALCAIVAIISATKLPNKGVDIQMYFSDIVEVK